MTMKDILNKLNLPEGVPGDCRPWTGRAIRQIREYAKETGQQIKTEAREVEIGPDFTHTFVRATPENGELFLLDGTGVGEHKPYFGPENEAPDHLRNSSPDMINHYLD